MVVYLPVVFNSLQIVELAKAFKGFFIRYLSYVGLPPLIVSNTDVFEFTFDDFIDSYLFNVLSESLHKDIFRFIQGTAALKDSEDQGHKFLNVFGLAFLHAFQELFELLDKFIVFLHVDGLVNSNHIVPDWSPCLEGIVFGSDGLGHEVRGVRQSIHSFLMASHFLSGKILHFIIYIESQHAFVF